MSTHFEINCPGCSRRLRIREAYLGLSIVCNHCNHSFVPAPVESSEPAPVHSWSEVFAERIDSQIDNAQQQRVLLLEEENGQLRSQIEACTQDAEKEAEGARFAHEELDRSIASLRLMEKEVQTHRSRSERDAGLLREMGDQLADRDFLQSEYRDLLARLEAMGVEAARQAEQARNVGAERDRFEQRCWKMGQELEQCKVERAELGAARNAAEAKNARNQGEYSEASHGWEVERIELQDEAGRRSAALDGAGLEILELRDLLKTERVDRDQQREIFRTEATDLSRQIETLRAENDAVQRELADVTRAHERLEDSLRLSLQTSDDLGRRHVIETGNLSQALAESQHQMVEASDQLEELEGQLRLAQAETAREAQVRVSEQRDHRSRLKTMESDRETERQAHLDRIAADAARHEDERSHHVREIAFLRDEADGLRADVGSLRLAIKVNDDERERIRAEVEVLVTGHAELRRKLEETCRDRDDLKNRWPGDQPEFSSIHESPITPQNAPEFTVAPSDLTQSSRCTNTPESPRTGGTPDVGETDPSSAGQAADVSERDSAAALLHLDPPPSPQKSHHQPGFLVSSLDPLNPGPGEGDEPWALWSLPEVSDLESARGQIAFLAELLRAAQQANQRLSERFTAFRTTTTRAAGTEASLAPQVLLSDQAAGKVKDELSWHLRVARRAAWLAERRRSGKS